MRFSDCQFEGVVGESATQTREAKNAKCTNLCRRVIIDKQTEQIAKLFIIEFVPTTRHSEIDCFCLHKKRMLLYHEGTVTFSMCKRHEIYSKISSFAYPFIALR